MCTTPEETAKLLHRAIMNAAAELRAGRDSIWECRYWKTLTARAITRPTTAKEISHSRSTLDAVDPYRVGDALEQVIAAVAESEI